MVHFDVGHWNKQTRKRDIMSFPPPAYSIRMQRCLDSGAWHVPKISEAAAVESEDFVSESRHVAPETVQWLCIKPSS